MSSPFFPGFSSPIDALSRVNEENERRNAKTQDSIDRLQALRRQQQDDELRQQKRQEDLNQRDFNQLMQLTQLGVPPKDSIPVLTHLTPGQGQFATSVFKTFKKKETEEQQRADLPGQVERAGLLQAGLQNPNLSPGARTSSESALADLNAAVDASPLGPEFRRRSTADAANITAGTEIGLAEDIATERRTVGRQKAREKREIIVGQDDDLVHSLSTAMGGVFNGEINQSDVDDTIASLDEIPGMTASRKDAIVSLATSQSLSEGIRRRAASRSVASGAQERFLFAEAERDSIRNQLIQVIAGEAPEGSSPDFDAIEAQVDKEMSQITDAQWQTVVSDRGFIDPYALAKFKEARFVGTFPKATVTRMRQTRVGQLELSFALDRLKVATLKYSGQVESGEAIGGAGIPDKVLDLFEAFGESPAAAIELRFAAREYVTALLKARQGSRPSDFDLKLYLAFAPTIRDMGNHQAMTKINALQRALDDQIRASGPDQARIMRFKSLPQTERTKKHLGKIDALIKEVTDADGNLIRELTDEELDLFVGTEAANWQATDGHKYRDPKYGLTNDPLVLDAVREALQ